jgi:hypothetical protein
MAYSPRAVQELDVRLKEATAYINTLRMCLDNWDVKDMKPESIRGIEEIISLAEKKGIVSIQNTNQRKISASGHKRAF